MKKSILLYGFILSVLTTSAQTSLVNTTKSPHAKLSGVGLNDVTLITGFWAERFATCRDVMVPELWSTYTSDSFCFAFQNFRIAAGLDTGRFRGPSFHDGDFYKTLEAVAAMYAATKDKKLDEWMDKAIAVIAKAQKQDGYIYTKNIIEQRKSGQAKMFDDKLSFEAYNFGHLMTAACVHYRATGKSSLLNIAKKAADFLENFYAHATPEQARNAICPSHYMGLTELYRTTGQKKYLTLAQKLIDIRGTVDGTDDNSDRIPFRDMTGVAGHAVRANYLFAGAADVYAETGDTSLLNTLNRLWDDVINHKMYITGGCGALYDGVSVDGTSYNPDTVQKIHQAYGRDYQLPNLTAHNETCANIGNLLWNWRMFLLTGKTKYADIVELVLYNSILSGVGLFGEGFFYTNPLAARRDYPSTLRWMGGRERYISKSNCCPPNVVRTIAEVSNYMYSIGDDGLYINLYGSSRLKTKLKDGSMISLEQVTNYPWDGKITITIKEAPAHPVTIHYRQPGWSRGISRTVNGMPQLLRVDRAGNEAYQEYTAVWKPGDKIELEMQMPATLIESNPFVEETRNQVAVKRGPLIYCLESPDLPKRDILGDIPQEYVFDVGIPSDMQMQPIPLDIYGDTVMALTGQAMILQHNDWKKDELYREVNKDLKPINIKLIPYFAWANRGRSDMTVWMPLIRRKQL